MSILKLFSKSQKKGDNKKAKILIADDEKYLNDFYVELLTGEGYEMLAAFNGEEALAMIVENQPDLVILDITMPLMNGDIVLKHVRENDRIKDTPVIILTNDANIETVTEVKLHHANRYFTKSNIEPPKLLQEISILLNSQT